MEFLENLGILFGVFYFIFYFVLVCFPSFDFPKILTFFELQRGLKAPLNTTTFVWQKK